MSYYFVPERSCLVPGSYLVPSSYYLFPSSYYLVLCIYYPVSPPNLLTQNSELCGCFGYSSFVESGTGVWSPVFQTDSRDSQSVVDVQLVVTIVSADGHIQCLEQTKQPMNIKTVCQEYRHIDDL